MIFMSGAMPVTASTAQAGSQLVVASDTFFFRMGSECLITAIINCLFGPPRLRKSQIERLYQSCGQGLLDEELIDEVGFSLYSRCISMLQVREAMSGNPPCPSCGASAKLDEDPAPFVRCANCGWSCPWALYQKTYQHKGLFAGGFEPFIRDFVRQFPATQSYQERMLLIDAPIHRFHWESAGITDGRPGATSLIQGKMKAVMAFLDRLSYGDNIPPAMARTREAWRRKWDENAWSKGKGQHNS